MQNKCGWRFNKTLGLLSRDKKKNKVGFIPNTMYQNKFWTELKN